MALGDNTTSVARGNDARGRKPLHDSGRPELCNCSKR
jgi:hypothetical protein